MAIAFSFRRFFLFVLIRFPDSLSGDVVGIRGVKGKETIKITLVASTHWTPPFVRRNGHFQCGRVDCEYSESPVLRKDLHVSQDLWAKIRKTVPDKKKFPTDGSLSLTDALTQLERAQELDRTRKLGTTVRERSYSWELLYGNGSHENEFGGDSSVAAADGRRDGESALFEKLREFDVLLFFGSYDPEEFDALSYHEYLRARSFATASGSPSQDHEPDESWMRKPVSHAADSRRPDSEPESEGSEARRVSRKKQRWLIGHKEDSCHPLDYLRQFVPPDQFPQVRSLYSDLRADVFWPSLYFFPRQAPGEHAARQVEDIFLRNGGENNIREGDSHSYESSRSPVRNDRDTNTIGRVAVPERSGIRDLPRLPPFLSYLDSPSYEDILREIQNQNRTRPILYISAKYKAPSNRDYWVRELRDLASKVPTLDSGTGVPPEKRSTAKAISAIPDGDEYLVSAGEAFYNLPEGDENLFLIRERTKSAMQPQLERYRDPRFAAFKFYLAAHNHNCRHYTDEKLVKPYYHGSVPIVVGVPKEDVLMVAPPKSFIHVDDFRTAKELKSYLEYMQFFFSCAFSINSGPSLNFFVVLVIRHA